VAHKAEVRYAKDVEQEMKVGCALTTLVVGALSVAGCGSAAKQRSVQTPAVVVNVSPADPSVSATAAHHHRRDATSRSRPHRSNQPRRARPVTHDPVTYDAIAHAEARLRAAAKHRPRAVLVFPTPPPAANSTSDKAAVGCMHVHGFYNVARRRAGVWAGTDPSNVQQLYVAGPYATAAAAAAAASPLERVEDARSGGLYIGFATFRSRLLGALRVVTACLAEGGPKRRLRF
jgi:hypothetical protein